jgi:hypothetical protein
MEYLATYGWAMLIAAAVAVFLYFYTTSASTIAPTTCTFSYGAYCQDMVVGSNSVSSAAWLYLTNSQQYMLVNPQVIVNVGGANSTAASCIPSNVLPGGAMLCYVTLAQSVSPGASISGKLYFSAIPCPSGNAASCSAGAVQNYVGVFSTQVAPAVPSVSTSISLSVRNSTQPATGSGDQLTATVTLNVLGSPISGATVSFSSNSQYVTLNPVNTTSDANGNALSIASSTTPGTVSVTATFAGISASNTITFSHSAYTSYPLTMSAGTGGSVTPSSGGTYLYGTSVPITATPTAGYGFRSWTGTGAGSYSGASSSTAITIDGAVTESAAFAQIFSLTMNSGTGGSVTPSSGNYLSGNTVQITAIPNSGYGFSGWTGTGTGSPYTGTSNPYSLTMNGNIIETANFPQIYTLTMNAGPNGSVSPSSGNYLSGNTVQITAIPNSGYGLVGWTGTGTGSYNGNSLSNTLTIGGNIVENAAFVLSYYVPILLINYQTSATPSGFQEMLTVPSNSYAAYINSGWTNVEFSSSAPLAYGGTPLNAWVESNPSNTVANTLVWVNLGTNTIPANGGTLILYMNFMPSNVMTSNTAYTGEAPQLNAAYGQYDNGNAVFTKYADFAGTSFASGWSAVSGTSGTDYRVNNGLQLLTSTARVQGPAVAQNVILENYNNLNAMPTDGWSFGVFSSTSSAYGLLAYSPTQYYYYNGAWTAVGSATLTIPANYVWQVINNAGSITTNWYTAAYSAIATGSFTSALSGAPIVIGERLDNADTALAMNDISYWIRTRAYPPGGVMPAASYGSATSTFPLVYSFSATAGPNGAVTCSYASNSTPIPSCGTAANYPYGTVITVNAVPSGTFTFAGWVGTGLGSYSGSSNPVNVVIGGPVTETASFVASYTFSVPAQSGGSIVCTPSCSGTYTYNTAFSATATPNAGNVVSWSCSGSSCSGTNSLIVSGTLSANTVVTANFIGTCVSSSTVTCNTLVSGANTLDTFTYLSGNGITTWMAPVGDTTVDATVLGGGGGAVDGYSNGSSCWPGGGGGGGYLSNYYGIPVTPGNLIIITVGAGGTTGSTATNGLASSFGTYNAAGGVASLLEYDRGGNGGSGGGGGTITSAQCTGGANGNNGLAGSGTAGIGQGTSTNDIQGVLRAGGGGGGNYGSIQCLGGSGGGGNGDPAGSCSAGTPGTNGFGGGGGGGYCGGFTAGYCVGTNGGSGIIIVRFKTN